PTRGALIAALDKEKVHDILNSIEGKSHGINKSLQESSSLLHKKISELSNDIATLKKNKIGNKTIGEHEEELNKLKEQLTTEKDEARQLANQLATEKDEARQLTEQLTAEKEKAQQLKEQLTAEKEKAQQLANQLATEKDEARQLKEQLINKEQEFHKKQDEINTKQDEINTKQDEINTKQDEVNTLRQTLEGMQSDTTAQSKKIPNSKSMLELIRRRFIMFACTTIVLMAIAGALSYFIDFKNYQSNLPKNVGFTVGAGLALLASICCFVGVIILAYSKDKEVKNMTSHIISDVEAAQAQSPSTSR
ncbi:MAG: hypothetical protein OEY79_00985, partial [Anaplasmataceae bacterium]|nr:hypothetical protein [Anaplasmataceae bacterium]